MTFFLCTFILDELSINSGQAIPEDTANLTPGFSRRLKVQVCTMVAMQSSNNIIQSWRWLGRLSDTIAFVDDSVLDVLVHFKFFLLFHLLSIRTIIRPKRKKTLIQLIGGIGESIFTPMQPIGNFLALFKNAGTSAAKHP